MPVRLLIVSSFGSSQDAVSHFSGKSEGFECFLDLLHARYGFLHQSFVLGFIASMIASIASSPSGFDARIRSAS